MSFVSIDTAKRLKKAGFPEPDTWVPGQVWFEHGFTIAGKINYIHVDGIPDCHEDHRFYGATIPELLPPGFMLYFHDDKWCAGDGYGVLFVHKDAIEVSALAWLSKHEPPKSIPQQGDEPF